MPCPVYHCNPHDPQVPEDLQPAHCDFPYHRPSVISVATADSTLMPESLGFVLLQVGILHLEWNCVIQCGSLCQDFYFEYASTLSTQSVQNRPNLHVLDLAELLKERLKQKIKTNKIKETVYIRRRMQKG